MSVQSEGFCYRSLFAVIFLMASHMVYAGAQVWDQLFEEQLANAEANDPDAQYEVAMMYLSGRGVKKDFDAALGWLGKAAANGNQRAASKLKRLQTQKKKFTSSLRKAESGQAASQYDVGMMYLKGRGVNQDAAQGRQWLEKAAAQSHKKAITRLAILLFKGEGGAPDYTRARQLLGSASESSALAQYYLGEIYASGKGVPRDPRIAMQWYRKAADNGFNMAGGKVINMEEEIRMESRRKANAARLAAARQQRVAEEKQAKAEAARKASAAKARVAAKKKVTVATNTKKAKVLSPLEKLALKRWLLHDKPIEYLPSAVTQCELDSGVLFCFSDELKRESGNHTVLYKVKSEVRKTKGGFTITYRNLVLGVENMDVPDEEEDVQGYDDEVDQGFSIQTGWTKAHQVVCKPSGRKALDCIKDKIHTAHLVEDVRLAGGGKE